MEHSKGITGDLQSNVWVVDDPATARRLIRWGADGIFTNDPGRLRGVLG